MTKTETILNKYANVFNWSGIKAVARHSPIAAGTAMGAVGGGIAGGMAAQPGDKGSGVFKGTILGAGVGMAGGIAFKMNRVDKLKALTQQRAARSTGPAESAVAQAAKDRAFRIKNNTPMKAYDSTTDLSGVNLVGQSPRSTPEQDRARLSSWAAARKKRIEAGIPLKS